MFLGKDRTMGNVQTIFVQTVFNTIKGKGKVIPVTRLEGP
jgi:hypothetical protein